jgi:hypothetical protein
MVVVGPGSGAALVPPPSFRAAQENHCSPPRSTKLDDKLKVLPPAHLQGRADPRSWPCAGAISMEAAAFRSAGRGPACQVVWEPRRAILPATRLALVLMIRPSLRTSEV